ncbi:hypothetical protein D3C80_2015250 [compost metagenome]
MVSASNTSCTAREIAPAIKPTMRVIIRFQRKVEYFSRASRSSEKVVAAASKPALAVDIMADSAAAITNPRTPGGNAV